MTFSDTFFEISAQLIPVLFLALVVQEKLQSDAEEDASDRVARSWAATFLLIGELLALGVVAGGLLPSPWVESVVSGGMLLAAMLISVPVLSREGVPERARWERRAHAAAGIVAVLAILSTIIGVGFG